MCKISELLMNNLKDFGKNDNIYDQIEILKEKLIKKTELVPQ
jgi:hypothetical protein